MSTYSTAVLADAPLVYYRLGETTGTALVDSSGNAHGAVSSAALPPGGTASLLPADAANGCITFDRTGVLGPATAQSAFGYDGVTLSVEFWINPIDLTDGGAGRPVVISNSTGGVGWDVYYDPTTGAWSWGNRGVGDANFTAVAVAGTTQHVVFTTTDTQTFSLYIDGELTQTVGPIGAALPTGAPVTTISGESYDGTRRLRAEIDEVAIYPSVLSATRVRAHFVAAGGVPANPSGAFIPKSWGNDPVGGTPLNAAGLNDLESRIANSVNVGALTVEGIHAYDYGVRSDGITPSAAFLQDAIDAAKTAYAGIVYLPSGGAPSAIMLESQIWVPDGIRLVGTSRRGSTLRAISGTFPTNTAVVRLGNNVVVPAPPNDVAFDARLENLAIYCSAITGSKGVDCHGLQEGAGLEHVGVYDFVSYAIVVNSSQNFRLYDLELYGYGGGGGTPGCVQVNGCPSFTIEYVTATPANTLTGKGIELNGCVGVTLRQIHAEQAKYGMWVESESVVIIGALGSGSCETLVFLQQNTNSAVVIGLAANGSTNAIVDDNTGYTGGVQFYAQSYATFGTGYRFASSPDSRPIGFQAGTFKVYSSTTANRQGAAGAGNGAMAFDSTLHKPIWSDGTNWRDASGAVV